MKCFTVIFTDSIFKTNHIFPAGSCARFLLHSFFLPSWAFSLKFVIDIILKKLSLIGRRKPNISWFIFKYIGCLLISGSNENTLKLGFPCWSASASYWYTPRWVPTKFYLICPLPGHFCDWYLYTLKSVFWLKVLKGFAIILSLWSVPNHIFPWWFLIDGKNAYLR